MSRAKYTLKERRAEPTLDLFAGTWVWRHKRCRCQRNPKADACTVCHNNKIAPDQFTDWGEVRARSHQSDNLNTSTHLL